MYCLHLLIIHFRKISFFGDFKRTLSITKKISSIFQKISIYGANRDINSNVKIQRCFVFCLPLLLTLTLVLSTSFTDTYVGAISLLYWQLSWCCLPLLLTRFCHLRLLTNDNSDISDENIDMLIFWNIFHIPKYITPMN